MQDVKSLKWLFRVPQCNLFRLHHEIQNLKFMGLGAVKYNRFGHKLVTNCGSQLCNFYAILKSRESLLAVTLTMQFNSDNNAVKFSSCNRQSLWRVNFWKVFVQKTFEKIRKYLDTKNQKNQKHQNF